MFKKITVVMFILALVAFTLIPENEARIDVVSSSITDASAVAEMMTGGETSFSYGADGRAMTLDIPRETPSQDSAPSSDFTPSGESAPASDATPAPSSTPAPTPTPLYSGVSGADVTKMQQKLIELGFLDGTADGIYGAGTVTAVKNAKAYINEHNKRTSGSVDEYGNIISSEAIDTLLNENGDGDYQFLSTLYNTDFSEYMTTLKTGDTNAAVKRLQTRLMQLKYLYKGADGAYGTSTAEAVNEFQVENGLPQSGIADVKTQSVLFSSAAAACSNPLWDYAVTVDLSEQRVYVHKWSEKTQDYTDLVKKFKCSTGASGTPTPKGVYKETVRKGEEWHHFKDFGRCWARYAIHIDPTGNIMFHSVLYTRKGGSPTGTSVRALGRRASHGCIRLAVADAKWLYESISDGTTVTIKK